ncbi:transposase [Actinosynnema sp. ALI-1.44]|uniref:transposase n=1 Tax=Actinosynnema sp. ALI-1.44 TaxID=1933779 RepID=UPI0022A91FB2|nr:transposase [Actinosynnema sp. ALI-1.44]
MARYPDGSCLSTLGTLRVRGIDCEITITTTAGRRHTGVYRLATTLLDHHRYPATELIRLYHQRWEIETAYLELKSSILGGRVLRARTPVGIEQEIYALFVTYQLLRTAMTEATATHPDLESASTSSPCQTLDNHHNRPNFTALRLALRTNPAGGQARCLSRMCWGTRQGQQYMSMRLQSWASTSSPADGVSWGLTECGLNTSCDVMSKDATSAW